MASLSNAFCAESQKVHGDHETLLAELAELQWALDHLVCYSEVYADLATAGKVRELGHNLKVLLPTHFVREEATVLATVARISPELADFAAQMKRQHKELGAEFKAFLAALQEFESSNDLDTAVCHIKESGAQFARDLGEHVALEERQLSGFL
ncbi:MAG TPA: hemerythrin domain-containing protein [Terriglobales bacterium]|nr:hemerythrin domain-containing protein [Terriglobales bacterium]